MNRAQEIIPAVVIAAVGFWVAYVSFTQEPAEAFRFPQLISIVFVILSLWTLGKAFFKSSEVGGGISLEMIKNLLPGLLVLGVYVFWAAKGLGFYTATTLAVFVALSLYDPAPHSALKSWIKRITITAGFITVMYCLFGLVLSVYLPKEIFF